MRRHPYRTSARAVAHHPEKRVRLYLGAELWTLTIGEATTLADQLVDAAEQLALAEGKRIP
ncbi:hypothetical protein [Rhodococcus pyridinivorans]